MIGWITRWRRLKELGILGMNQRNAECILDLNPRGSFPVVDSKRLMAELCARLGVLTPALYGGLRSHSALRRLPELLAGRDDFVIKPDRGAGGRGILVVTGRDGDRFVRHNGEVLEPGDLRQHVSSVVSGLFSLGERPDEALIQQRVLLHPAFERISFQGIGDVRVILYRKTPVMAMLRLPTRESGGRANLHQGGIGAGVDLETGRTCQAVMRNRLTARHPDTGASLVGFAVPCWPQILDMACRVAAAVGLGYLGVDIVVDRDQGPLLLEANARPGLAIQIANGQGLLPRLLEIDRRLAGEPVVSSARSIPEPGGQPDSLSPRLLPREIDAT
jgi:alpha-L-glutamate ligase-like protein